MDDARHDQLVGAIYQAALEPELWESVMIRIADLIQAVGGHYFIADIQSGGLAFSSVGRLPLAGEQDYAEHYHAINPNVKALFNMPAGQWAYSHKFFDEAFVRRDEFHQDFLRPHGVKWMTGNSLAQTGPWVSVLSFIRSSSKEVFHEDEVLLLQRLTGHLQRAAQLMHKTLHLQQQAEIGTDALNQLDLALAVCDGFGAIRFANPAAEAILRQGEGLCGLKGQLTSLDDNGQLRRLLDEACSRGHGGALALARPFRKPLHIMVTPLAPHAAGLNPWQRPLALVLICDPDRQPVIAEHQLSALFRFTPAESRLAQALLGGAELTEYAGTNGLSVATVRTQLRALLSKTGTRRQAELVRLLASVQAHNTNRPVGGTPA